MKTTDEIRVLLAHGNCDADDIILDELPALLDALDEERHRSDAYEHRCYEAERKLYEMCGKLDCIAEILRRSPGGLVLTQTETYAVLRMVTGQPGADPVADELVALPVVSEGMDDHTDGRKP